LFHYGLSVGHTMEIVREHTSLGRDYVVLGDPGVTLAQCENVLPTIFYVEQDRETEDDELMVETHSYPIRSCDIGVTVQTYLPGAKKRYVAVGAGYEMQVTFDTFRQSFRPFSEPLIVDGELTWTDTWLDT
jgi:hypothetical protein